MVWILLQVDNASSSSISIVQVPQRIQSSFRGAREKKAIESRVSGGGGENSDLTSKKILGPDIFLTKTGLGNEEIPRWSSFDEDDGSVLYPVGP